MTDRPDPWEKKKKGRRKISIPLHGLFSQIYSWIHLLPTLLDLHIKSRRITPFNSRWDILFKLTAINTGPSNENFFFKFDPRFPLNYKPKITAAPAKLFPEFSTVEKFGQRILTPRGWKNLTRSGVAELTTRTGIRPFRPRKLYSLNFDISIY